MNQATLIVTRINDRELRTVLQLSQEQHRPALLEARAFLAPSQREQILRQYEDFAECFEGFHSDEPKLKELGQVFFSVVFPQAIRAQVRKITIPLTILTDDPHLPWEILHDDNDFLSLKLPVARQLIIQDQMAGLLNPPEIIQGEFRALVIADPTSDLPGAREEGLALHDFFRANKGASDLLLGEDADWSNIQRYLVRRPYSIIHFCGHVDYDANEQTSSIRLQNGHLPADGVLATFRGKPIVFLNACYSDLHFEARTASVRTESFAQAFMLGNEHGVASAVIGTMWRIPDEPEAAGRQFTLNFYQKLLKGGSIGEAMRTSRLLARKNEWGPMMWGPYILYGDPCLEPFKGSELKTSSTSISAPIINGIEEPEIAPSSSEPEIEEPKETPPETPKLTKEASLDTAARRIFYLALREMKQMENSGLTSMHLLLGLCDAKANVVPLQSLLAEKEIAIQEVQVKTRQTASELLSPDMPAFGISRNTLRVLVYADKRAKRHGRKKISGEDLLAGLLRSPKSAAIYILTTFGIPRRELLGRLSTVPSGLFKPEKFDKATEEAIQHAQKCAIGAYLNFLGTPHLLVGLIRTGGVQTITILRHFDINLEQLCEQLLIGVGIGSPPINGGRIVPSLVWTQRSFSIYRLASELAWADGRSKISEIHLLQAILEDRLGFTANLLRHLGAPPEKLLEMVWIDKG